MTLWKRHTTPKKPIIIPSTSLSSQKRTKQRLFDDCGCAVEEGDADSQVADESKADADGLEVKPDSEKSLGHVCNPGKQAEIARIIKESSLGILKGKSNYVTWAADVETVLRGEKISYVLTPYVPLNNIFKQYDDWLARKIIYAHISTARANRLRSRIGPLKFAWNLWSELYSDVSSCPCNNLKEVVSSRYEELVKFQESAEDGCSYCKLILDVVEAFTPGWISRSYFWKESKSVSVLVSSYLIQIALDGGQLWRRNFEFFVQPGQ